MTRTMKSFITHAIIFHPKMIALGGAFASPTPLLAIPPLAQSRFVTTRSVEFAGKLDHLIGHIAVLRKTRAALRLQSAGDGSSIAISGWQLPVWRTRPKRILTAYDSRILESPDQDDHDDQIPPDLNDSSIRSDPRSTDHLHLDHDHAFVFEK